jgi:serine/threonine-protein kinase
VLPGGRQEGRRTVVHEYAKQFASMDVTAYDVSGLSVRSGDAGRAEGTYTVRRRGAASFGGRFVLGVVKEHGRVRIRLIAATPA